MTTTDRNISRTTRTLLTHRDKPKTELAHYLDISPSVLSKKLGCRRAWSAADVARLAGFFDVSESLFFGDPDTLVKRTCFRQRVAA